MITIFGTQILFFFHFVRCGQHVMYNCVFYVWQILALSDNLYSDKDTYICNLN